MKTHKVRPVLIEIKFNLIEEMQGDIILRGNKLYTCKQLNTLQLHKKESNDKVFELVLISLEDEKIEVGDLYIMDEFLMNPVQDENEADRCNNHPSIAPFCKKVIASQSQISPEYISKFIEQYNNDCLEDLEIEMGIRSNAALGYKEYVYLEHICDKKYVPIKIDANINQNSYSLGEIEEFEDWEIEIYTKLTNGFVTIVEKEYSHNLLSNMQYYMEYCQANGYVTPQDWLNKFKHYSDRKKPISYTEEEVNKLLHKFLDIQEGLNTYQRHASLDTWFENNKKK